VSRPLRVAVLASGGGSNLQALIDHAGATRPSWAVVLVISDRPGAGALERAARHGLAREVVVAGAGQDPAAVASRLLELLERHVIDLVLLAGYLRLVPAAVVARFAGRILNIHPALLPSFGGKGMYGMHVHRAVLESGVRLTGVTVHVVDDVYDRGRILAQWPVPVKAGDTPEVLAARVLEVEHALYPRAVDHVARALDAGVDIVPLEESGEGFRLGAAPAEWTGHPHATEETR
jgi:phosphoribosylglycinamide formyltransferase 1